MLRRSTWILLGVFVLLAGFAWFFQRYQASKADTGVTATPTVPPEYLYDLSNTDVKEIFITDSSGSKIDLHHDSAATNWSVTGIPEDKVDTSKIESVSSQLFSLQAQETFTQTLPLDSIGLVTPTYTITITTSEGTQINTYIGTETAIGSGYYARVESGQVVIVDKVVVDDILNLLKNPPLLPTPTPEASPTGTAITGEQEIQATPTP